jgi:hypothetical protein
MMVLTSRAGLQQGALSGSSALHLGMAVLAGWGVIAIVLSLIVLKNFGGAADWAARMVRPWQKRDEYEEEEFLESYRLYARIFFVLGMAAIIFAIVGFLK